MATIEDRHHQTEIQPLPSVGFSLISPVKRPVPVEQIYQLKKRARPVAGPPETKTRSGENRASLFFGGKTQVIKGDWFLNRMSRLK